VLGRFKVITKWVQFFVESQFKWNYWQVIMACGKLPNDQEKIMMYRVGYLVKAYTSNFSHEQDQIGLVFFIPCVIHDYEKTLILLRFLANVCNYKVFILFDDWLKLGDVGNNCVVKLHMST
jgi:hypothetical protein